MHRDDWVDSNMYGFQSRHVDVRPGRMLRL